LSSVAENHFSGISARQVNQCAVRAFAAQGGTVRKSHWSHA
jgi:hypothetical protein